jgi:signal transduction histidine kinase
VEEALLARGQELKQSRDVLRLLMTQQEKEREQERKRIAWEVHEELGQNLMALRMNLSMLHARLEQDSAPMQEQFRSTKDLLDRSIRVARTVTTSLRPKVLDLGIVSALEWLVEEFVKQTDIACELRHEVAEAALNEDFVVAIFRFAEEALDNVARHADARWVEVSLERCEGNYLLCVRDDGKGFDTDPREHRSIGLLSMQERARALGGETTITSTQGKGTEIAVRIPA